MVQQGFVARSCVRIAFGYSVIPGSWCCSHRAIHALSKPRGGVSCRTLSRGVPSMSATVDVVDGINVICISGTSHSEMGTAYGRSLAPVLQGARDDLVASFAASGVSHQQLTDHAAVFQERYSYPWSLFLDGMATGAGLELRDAMMLNAMETLVELLPPGRTRRVRCALVFAPPKRTASLVSSIIGRNYDYDASIFGRIASNLTVTILRFADSLPTAIVGLPGQIYCPSCFNSRGVFMELNDGSPSGGAAINQQRQSMLIRMLSAMQTSPDLASLHEEMRGLESDYSLVVNTADALATRSYEFSSNASLGSRPFTPSGDHTFVSTNYFLNASWPWGSPAVPWPNDDNTWNGVTRRSNLLNLTTRLRTISVAAMQRTIATPLGAGGAQDGSTIYQLVFEPSTLNLSLRRPLQPASTTWVNFSLRRYMPHRTPLSSTMPHHTSRSKGKPAQRSAVAYALGSAWVPQA